MKDIKHMKIYEIKDNDKLYGYLIYYKKTKSFYIELNSNIELKDSILFFDYFYKNKKYSIDSYWSKIWVQQRIVPPDRQNIGSILKANHLNEYDEFALLISNNGRCSQDDLYLEEIDEKSINIDIKNRFLHKLEDVIVSKDSLLCFFRNGITKRITFDILISMNIRFNSLLTRKEFINNYKLQADGYGIIFNDTFTISNIDLYNNGIEIDISLDDFKNYVNSRIINTNTACEILNCSRQNINDLVKRDKLHPIREDDRNYLFNRNEIEQRD